MIMKPQVSWITHEWDGCKHLFAKIQGVSVGSVDELTPGGECKVRYVNRLGGDYVYGASPVLAGLEDAKAFVEVHACAAFSLSLAPVPVRFV